MTLNDNTHINQVGPSAGTDTEISKGTPASEYDFTVDENNYSSAATSGTSSRQSSIYRHNHCSNQKPLNVLNAHIVNDSNQYVFDNIPETKDICLPNHSIDDINEISVDIGGSLAKVVYFTKDPINEEGVRLNFYKIETDKIDRFIEFLNDIITKNFPDRSRTEVTVIATGGGAHKYHDKLEDEMQCLIIGLDFFITGIKNEIFYYDEDDNKYIEIEQDDESSSPESVYPYLLVNIGSGVSMIKVTGPNEGNFERVGGSSLGGGTLWGLLSILTDCNSFDEMLEMASLGNNENVDLLVGDIYGKSYNKIGLKSNHIASSMGKVFKEVLDTKTGEKLSRMERLEKFDQRDIARSMLYAVSYNIGQISYLQAQRYDLKKIYFAGSYIRNHNQTIRTLSFAIDFWSQGEKKAYFLNHEGYLGAMGAFLMRRNEPIH
ncbi:pantothenate kinase [Pichia kudriavzevii]|uniref:pantothenate kinase n=1 Tax=Pichia kudriavzevii TaxID=4909 RepID=A0A1Z8JNH8_PICKU|nr:pantothenate kinase [Pichia kudriavzevii]